LRDPRLLQIKFRAERDKGLSDGAARLFALIVSDRYLSRDHSEEAFPLPWSLVARWTGIKEDQAYRRLRELESCGYLKSCGVQGCPPTTLFRVLVLGRVNSRIKAGIESRIKAGISSRKKAGNLLSMSLRDKEKIEEHAGGVSVADLVARCKAAAEKGE